MTLTRKAPLAARSPLKPAKTVRSTLKSRASKPSKIRLSAKGELCLVRVPGVCNGDPATVVLAHLNGAGAGMKNPDWQAAYACSSCHAFLDGGYANSGIWREQRDLLHLQGVIRTQSRLIDKGFIQIQGAV